MKEEKPLCYHLYNNSKIMKFQHELPIFYKIYNVSAIEMHQMSLMIGGTVRGVFTDTIIFEGDIKEPKLNTDIIGGIRKTEIKEFTKCTYTEPRKTEYGKACPKVPKLQNIDEYVLGDKGVFITGNAGTGKTYLTNKLKESLESNQYRVCTPTHKSSL